MIVRLILIFLILVSDILSLVNFKQDLETCPSIIPILQKLIWDFRVCLPYEHNLELPIIIIATDSTKINMRLSCLFTL